MVYFLVFDFKLYSLKFRHTIVRQAIVSQNIKMSLDDITKIKYLVGARKSSIEYGEE